MKSSLSFVVFVLCALLVPGCARLPQPSSPSARSADAVFSQLAEEYLSGYFAWRPQTGTTLGFHQYDGKVTDFSPTSLAAELARLKSFDQKLAALDPSALSPQASYDYRILRGAIQREIFSFDQAQIYTQNPMTYSSVLDVNIYIKRNFAPLADRVRSITAVLKQAPRIVAAAHANLADSLPRPLVETAIEEAGGIIDFLGKDLVEALKPVTNQKIMAEFRDANSAAIEEMRNYVTYLKDEKLPKANDHYALGREKYVKLLQAGELITLPPEQLLEIGMRELHRKQQVFADAARQIEPGQKPIEVFKAIQKEHPTEQTLISDTAKDLDNIRQFVLAHHIMTVPSRVRAGVTETPQFLRATSFASMDTPGPFETKATEAYYYVTPPEPGWTPGQKEEWLTAFNYYTTDIVSIHEAYPGHYVQFLALKASPATKLEKIFGSYAFIEGWAHYCEQMLVDEGFGAAHSPTDTRPSAFPKYRLAQTDEALLRVCRLCVSIKMHCQGMTVDEAAKFFEENCYYEPKTARSEAMRGTFDPEYLYYTLGKLEILKLREDYRKQEGANFSLRKFHDELLRHGAPPIRLLREVMLKDRSLWPGSL
jgi:uncharacterized protein (DUF885 family)